MRILGGLFFSLTQYDIVFTHMNEIDQYINQFPTKVMEKLTQIRALIQELAPDAVEHMSYGMPAYQLNGKPLVYFAGYANHIGFYALPSGHDQFVAELSGYKQGRGSVQFPIEDDLPLDLIHRIVEFRVEENQSISHA